MKQLPHLQWRQSCYRLFQVRLRVLDCFYRETLPTLVEWKVKTKTIFGFWQSSTNSDAQLTCFKAFCVITTFKALNIVWPC